MLWAGWGCFSLWIIPVSLPDPVPVVGAGHEQDHAAPRAGGQSVPGPEPPGLAAPPPALRGQTRQADILGAGLGNGSKSHGHLSLSTPPSNLEGLVSFSSSTDRRGHSLKLLQGWILGKRF